MPSHLTQRAQLLARRLLPIVAFLCMLTWVWRVTDLFTRLPAPEDYGDPFEVLWLIDRFHTALLQGGLPHFVPEIWHPSGLFIGALGYTPATFLVMMPFRAVGNAVFAFNVSALLGVGVCYFGMYVLARRFGGVLAATVAALLFTFAPFMNERIINGHANILFAMAILPFLVLALLKFIAAENAKLSLRTAILSGVVWGVLIHFQLYGIWWGALLWVLIGLVVWRARGKTGALHSLVIPAVAAAVASPTLIYYAVTSAQAQLVTDGLPALAGWGASLNSLTIPSIHHPIQAIRNFATAVYSGIPNESGIANWGLALTVIGVVGGVTALRTTTSARRNEWRWLVSAALLSFVLALGLAVKWNGQTVDVPLFAPFDRAIWKLGEVLKPALFVPEEPVKELANTIPTPAYLLSAFVPRWDTARVYARFSFISGIVLAMLATYVLSRQRRAGQLALAALLLVEVLPAPTNDLPVPTRAHPAYEWISAHDGQPSGDWQWNILNISDAPDIVPILLGGKVIYSARLHNLAVSSGFGSYPARQIAELRTHMLQAKDWATDMRTPFYLRALRVRYILVHRIFNKDTRVWDALSRSPFFESEGCFQPFDGISMWPHDICMVKTTWQDGDPVDMIPSYNWSPEPWGIWAASTSATGNWMAARPGEHHVRLHVFPSCIYGQHQTMSVKVNGTVVGEHAWTNCDNAELDFLVPANVVKQGWNEIAFNFAYAAPPAGEYRILAAGFSQLTIRP